MFDMLQGSFIFSDDKAKIIHKMPATELIIYYTSSDIYVTCLSGDMCNSLCVLDSVRGQWFNDLLLQCSGSFL